MASDFSINRFKDLQHLILWHGRQSYYKTTLISHFVIHRGLIISFMQAIFMTVFYFVEIALFNGYLQLGYTTIFTFLPSISLILDEDVPLHAVFKYPPLY